MNQSDHPLGGENEQELGRPLHPVSPWGRPAKGYKTRRNKATTKFILERRKK